MIKVPATADGILAIQELINAGVNVNATLMFFYIAIRYGGGSLHLRPGETRCHFL
jgi:hypothetical protein